MALTKAKWTTNVALRDPPAIIPSGQAEQHEFDLAALGGDVADVMVDIVLGAASSVEVEFLKSVDGGTSYATVPDAGYTATADDRRPTRVSGTNIRLRLINNGGGDSGLVSARYQWREWETT